jgi:curved DNA-binding protein CbpA
MSKSYYEVLDVSPDASEETIRDAYRKKVKEHHPDQSDDPDANDKFRRIREAKETLLDEQARRQYDRRQQREAAKGGNEQGESDESSESSEEWAREQRRRERQQQRDRQQRRRQQRQQRRERRQRRQRREEAATDNSSSGGRSRDRADRQTETRTREREETSSRERSRSASRSVRGWMREGIQWLRDAYYAPKRWVYANFRSQAATRQFVAKTARSPTVLRLVAAVAMIVTVMQLTAGQSLSMTAELAIVVGAVVASYLLYAVVSPLPFESPRSRERFKPAGRAPIWPAVVMNLTALGLFGLAAVRNVSTAGIGFTMVVGTYTLSMWIVFGMFLTVAAVIGHQFFTDRNYVIRSLKFGLIGPVVPLFVLTFTRLTGAGIFRDGLTEVVSSASPAPWLPWFMIGPVNVGLFVNYMIAIAIIVCLFGSVVAMGRYLTVVPWSDRFEHGYRVRPDAWNLAVALPFVILGWMTFAGVSVVNVGGFALSQSLLWVAIFVLPTILAGAYLLRRQVEPYLQKTVWQA